MHTTCTAAFSSLSCALICIWAIDAGKASAQTTKLNFTPSPSRLRFVSTVGADATKSPLVQPLGVAVDNKAGRILVADPGHRAVMVYDKQGVAGKWTGNTQFPLYGPVSLAMHADGRLFVSDTYQAHVVVFDANGKPSALFGKGVLKRPSGIAIDAARGRIYVADVRLQQVLWFDLTTGAPGKTIGSPADKNAAEPGRFASPVHVAVNSRGDLYVTDTWNCRVQVFGSDGVLLRSFPTQCSKADARGPAWPIAIDAQDRVFVASQDDAMLQVFDASGQPLHAIPAALAHPKQQTFRTALALDGSERIYVAERHDREGCIQIFTQVRGRGRSR